MTGRRRAHTKVSSSAGRPGSVFLAALVLLVAFAAVPTAESQSWYDSGWSSRQRITIDSDAAAYGLSGGLTDFPFLVKITNAGNDLFAKAQGDGDDILFTASDGATKIPHEIESFSRGAGSEDLTAWVLLPTFAHDADTVIYIYYGNPAAGNQQSPYAVWDGNYASVWHLRENGGVSEYRDSTRNGNTMIGGTVTANRAPTRTADAVAGYAQDFPNADDVIDVGGWDVSGNSLTLSAWFNHTAGTADDRFISKANGNPNENTWWQLGLSTGSALRFRLMTGGVSVDYSAGAITNGVWTLATGVYDGTKMNLYQNGTLVGSWAKTGDIDVDPAVLSPSGTIPPRSAPAPWTASSTSRGWHGWPARWTGS